MATAATLEEDLAQGGESIGPGRWRARIPFSTLPWSMVRRSEIGAKYARDIRECEFIVVGVASCFGCRGHRTVSRVRRAARPGAVWFIYAVIPYIAVIHPPVREVAVSLTRRGDLGGLRSGHRVRVPHVVSRTRVERARRESGVCEESRGAFV